MGKYEPGDIATFYFVVFDNGDTKLIKGWTDNKDLAKLYMDFHSCKHFRLKSVTKSIEQIAKITEENWNDEIQIHNIVIRNPEKKRSKGKETITIGIPATRTECAFIDEEAGTFQISMVRYSYLNSAIPYLKNKYQDALENIFLQSIIDKVCSQRSSPIVESLKLDNLLLLFRSFPETFGK